MSTTENRLHRETSPYLLQHKDNPVHWWAWGPDALAEAKRTGKPILLSVGYAACHWCHVMAHESFEDAETAAVMNELYVNIKVDREERPDIDAIYMASLLRFSDQAGWPLTMFLDSDARPFWGGTYFPKGPRWGRPAFVDVLKQIANAHRTQPERVRDKADSILKGLVKPAAPATPAAAFGESQVLALLATLTRAVDPVHGGLSGAPKFPQWNVFWLLWRGAIRFRDEAAKQAVITTLTHICQGGIYDHLGGGFARYSVDKAWLVPHFEKMLYDNALLIQLLTEVWRETHDPLFAARISETVAWLAREMIAEDGGFAASLDADSEGEEGKFYLWTEDEIASVLGAEDAAVFAAVYGVSKNGNFEGHTILNRLDSMALLTDAEEDRLAHFRARLLAHRATRVRPGWDDKVLADWNGLMIAALARAAQVFARPEWLAMAERAFACVSERMALPNGRLWHSFRAGQAKAPATAADYANMIWGALQLYQATGRAPYLTAAKSWTQSLDRHYWDGARGGYRTTADDTADVIIQLRPAHDDAVPSPNAVQLSNVLALAALTGDAAYATRAGDLYAAYQADIATSPTGHCGLLAASLDLEDLTQIVLVSGNPVDDAALRESLYNLSVPGALEFCCVGNSQETLPMALRGKTATDGKSRAYVCEGTECGLPVFDTDALKRRLEEARASNTAQR